MVELKGIYDAYKVRGTAGSGSAPVRKTDSSPAVSTESRAESGDVIEISAQAAFKAQVDSAARQYAAQYQSEVSDARMETLRAQYQGDSCPVSAQDTAQAILDRISGAGA